jgi:MFS family permease
LRRRRNHVASGKLPHQTAASRRSHPPTASGDRPAQADWLEAEGQEWLATEMDKERQTVETGRTISVLQSLFNPRVLALAAIHFGQAGVSVGIAVFAAQIIKQLGLTNMQTGFTTAIPYVLGTIGMIVWGSYSDRKNERRWNLAASCTTMAVGCLIAGLLDNSYWAVVGLSLATIGLYASQAHLFPLPAVFLTGPALASGIAWSTRLASWATAPAPRSSAGSKMPPAAPVLGTRTAARLKCTFEVAGADGFVWALRLQPSKSLAGRRSPEHV